MAHKGHAEIKKKHANKKETMQNSVLSLSRHYGPRSVMFFILRFCVFNLHASIFHLRVFHASFSKPTESLQTRILMASLRHHRAFISL